MGLISGTSADGIDAAIVEIEKSPASFPPFSLRLLCFITLPIPQEIHSQIISCSESGSTHDICQLNFHLGELFAQATMAVIKKAGLRTKEVELIGSHGQTIQHLPPLTSKIGSTLQIAEPAIIAHKTGITTVADFRVGDMAAFGQGAPLLPLLHYHLFSVPGKNVGVINIGGISNASFLSENVESNSVLAFDTGPGNMIIDSLTQKYFDRPYDKDGQLAAEGETNSSLLNNLMQHPFLVKKPPKSTGREEFGASFTEEIIRQKKLMKISDKDILHTVTEFTARSIASNCWSFFSSNLDQVWICGGGVKNSLLMRLLVKEFSPIPVKSTAVFGVNPDALEAMGFAYLAYRTIEGLPGNLSPVTGAREAMVLGKIVPGKNYTKTLIS